MTSASALRLAPDDEPAPWTGRNLVFIHLNTTGIGSTDRLVSFAAVRLDLAAPGEITALHLVFDPGCADSAEAARLHGYSEKELRAQDRFDAYAKPLRAWLETADLLIADSAWELRVLRNALAAAGPGELAIPDQRTLRSFRFFGETPPSLDATALRAGAPRDPRHGALRDAWLCMQTFLWVHGLPWRLDFALCGDPKPANYRQPALSVFESFWRRSAWIDIPALPRYAPRGRARAPSTRARSAF